MSKQLSIQEENGLYVVQDRTEGGFINRFDRLQYNWKTVWDINLELIEMIRNNDDVLPILVNTEYTDYRQVVLAKSRHLKELKIHLGIIKPEVSDETYIIYFDNIKNKFACRKGIVKAKTFEITGGEKFRKSNTQFIAKSEVTEDEFEEKRQLALEYNKKVDELSQLRRNTKKQLIYLFFFF